MNIRINKHWCHLVNSVVLFYVDTDNPDDEQCELHRKIYDTKCSFRDFRACPLNVKLRISYGNVISTQTTLALRSTLANHGIIASGIVDLETLDVESKPKKSKTRSTFDTSEEKVDELLENMAKGEL